MDDLVPLIDHRVADEGRHVSNPYADLAEGERPPELITFELSMGPYTPIGAARWAADGTPIRRKSWTRTFAYALLLACLFPGLLLFLGSFASHVAH